MEFARCAQSIKDERHHTGGGKNAGRFHGDVFPPEGAGERLPPNLAADDHTHMTNS